MIETSKLDDIRPNYEATLHISTPDEALYVALQCQGICTTFLSRSNSNGLKEVINMCEVNISILFFILPLSRSK